MVVSLTKQKKKKEKKLSPVKLLTLSLGEDHQENTSETTGFMVFGKEYFMQLPHFTDWSPWTREVTEQNRVNVNITELLLCDLSLLRLTISPLSEGN